MMADAFPWDQPSFRFPRRRTALRNFFPGWPVSSREIKSDSNGSLLPLPSLFSFFFPLFTVALIFCARGFTNAPPLCAKRADTTNERRTNDERTRRAFHALRLQPILFRWNLFIVRTRVFGFALSSNLLSGFHFRFEYVSFGF